MLNTTAGSPGEPGEAAGSRRDAAMQEKHVANEAPERGWPGLQRWAPTMKFPCFRMHKGSFMPLVAKPYRSYWLKPDSSVPPTSPLSRSVWPPRDGAVQTCGEGELVWVWGCGLQKQQKAGAWSTFTVQLQGESRSLLACCRGFGRGRRKSGGRSDLTARCAGKWPCTQWAPHIPHFSKWKWILWDCPFC